jgi:hypothetical protein
MKNKLLTSAALSLAVSLGVAFLALTEPLGASTRESASVCPNLSCYGARTCEYHTGTSCDVSNPKRCVVEAC